MYLDRIDAGMKLAEALKKYRNDPAVILAVPRGGVPVAYVVAQSLQLPMDLLLSKKIGHPLNREYAIGAVGLSDRIVVPHPEVNDEYIEDETKRIRQRLRSSYRQLMGDKAPLDLTAKTVILIDDGVATGNTLLSSINMLRRNKPAKIVIAAPVASRSAIEKLSSEVDDVVCPLVPLQFRAVGEFYENFDQVSDEEVKQYIDKLNTSDT